MKYIWTPLSCAGPHTTSPGKWLKLCSGTIFQKLFLVQLFLPFGASTPDLGCLSGQV